MSKEHSPARAGKRCRIVTSEKGGTWKTATAGALACYERMLGIDVRVVQVDDQPRLPELLGDFVETIVMPTAEKLRQNDLADAEALEPLVETMFTHEGTTIADFGANYDERGFSTFASIDLDHEAKQQGIDIAVIVPMTTLPDAVILAARTMERARIALPSARIVPMLCDDGGNFAKLGSAQAQKVFDKEISPLVETGEAMLHPRLLPRVAAVIGNNPILPWDLAEMTPTELAEVLTGFRFVARGQIAGDAAKWKARLLTEFHRHLPHG